MSMFEVFTGPLKSARRAIIALLVMQTLTLIGLSVAIYFAFESVAHCAR